MIVEKITELAEGISSFRTEFTKWAVDVWDALRKTQLILRAFNPSRHRYYYFF